MNLYIRIQPVVNVMRYWWSEKTPGLVRSPNFVYIHTCEVGKQEMREAVKSLELDDDDAVSKALDEWDNLMDGGKMAASWQQTIRSRCQGILVALMIALDPQCHWCLEIITHGNQENDHVLHQVSMFIVCMGSTICVYHRARRDCF